MAQAQSTWAMKTRKEKKRGFITCRSDRANEANKIFIIFIIVDYYRKGTKLFDILTGDQELEVRTAT